MLMSLDVSDIVTGFSADDISITHYSPMQLLHMHDVIKEHTLSPNTCINK